ncbi:MAG: DUF3817 domain-containing protein [Actinomycetota bacterium]|jgi:hypothetical protein
MQQAYRWYHRLSLAVGTTLLIFVFIAIPLRYFAQIHWPDMIIAPLHGYLYLAYLAAAMNFCLKFKVKILDAVLLVLVGLVPGLVFLMDRRIFLKYVSEKGIQ